MRTSQELRAAAQTPAEQLRQACVQLGLVLSPDQHARLLEYLDLLGKWNSAYNLTAVRELQDQLVLHLFDCLAIMPAVNSLLMPDGIAIDVGSGGGLPGVVIAICRPDVQVHTVDAVGKKAAFIRQVRGALGLTNLHSHHARIENLIAAKDLPAASVITSRAFASLSEMLGLTRHLLTPDGCWAAMKGVWPADELDALPSDVEVRDTVRLQVPQLEAQRHLIVLALRNRPSN